MNIKSVIDQINSVTLDARLGGWIRNEEIRAKMLEPVEFLSDLIGPHDVPATEEAYADLMDELLDEPSDFDAIRQMQSAGRTIALAEQCDFNKLLVERGSI